MQTVQFDYYLPTELIAQHPVEPRDQSRLMVVDARKKTMEHRHFFDIVEYLKKGDLLVWNNSKVFKARLFGKLISADGQELREHKKPVEIFLVRPTENLGVWQALAKPGRHVGNGMRVVFKKGRGLEDDFYCDVIAKDSNGTILVQFPFDEDVVREKANLYGHVPLPPYIKDEKHELESYQTVYAKHEGSVAAPTAGFHFTPQLIDQLKARGVEFAEVTLHVGLGTFLPVKSERVEDHLMHSEWVELSPENAEKINRAKREGRRVIAVGTTTVRVLEGAASFFNNVTMKQLNNETIQQYNNIATQIVMPYSGEINLFITPGFHFRIVDAMITNFHLPKSTLLMLVCAFAGDATFMLSCYQEAIRQKYRFYSFGDAMYIY